MDLPVDGPGTGYLHEAKDQTGAMDRIAARCVRVTSHQQIADAVTEAFAAFSLRTPSTDPPRGSPRPARRHR